MSIIAEFREFVNRGNVLDLAVGVVIGAAFTKIVDALVTGLINPVVGLATGGVNFGEWGIPIGQNAAGDPLQLQLGGFVSAIVNFLVVAWVVFIIVKAANKARSRFASPTEAAPAAPTQEELLAEIRDLLKTNQT